MILIGSRAAAHRGLRIHRNVIHSDWDIIGTKDEMDDFLSCYESPTVKESSFKGKYRINVPGASIEFDATENPSNQELNSINRSHFDNVSFTIGKNFVNLLVPNSFILYQIKLSHVNFGVHFDKTIMDIRAMQKQWHVGGAWCRDTEFFKLRHQEAKERDGARQERIKLNKPNDEFFKGGMNLRTYVHDDLHRAVAFNFGQPMFERCKPDLSLAAVSHEMFKAMPYEDQIRMAMEESMVIALEREYIPRRKVGETVSDKAALYMYRKGMLKEIKDLSKGWFQNFMIDNILVIEVPQWDYIARFEEALAAGKIREKDTV